MQIQLQIKGGFAALPGLTRPITIDTTKLPEQEARTLTNLVHAAHFFQLQSQPHPTRGADHQQYTLSINTPHQHHTLTLFDPIPNEPLHKLISFIKKYRSPKPN